MASLATVKILHVEAFPINATEILAGRAHSWICKRSSYLQVYWSNSGTQFKQTRKYVTENTFSTANINTKYLNFTCVYITLTFFMATKCEESTMAAIMQKYKVFQLCNNTELKCSNT
jgi:hypothetical protein